MIKMQKWFKEPLLHFLLIGAAIFLFFELTNPSEPDTASTKSITVSDQQVEQLAARFETTWSRAPTMAELKLLIDAYLREEILSQEARALSMDQGDAVIRQRLVQKMQFLIDSTAAAAPPTDAQLQEFFADNADRYTPNPELSFEQIYLGEAPSTDEIDQTLTALRSGADPTTLGRRIMLPDHLRGVGPRPVDSAFGNGFFSQLEALATNEWTAPIRSGFGLHAVRLLHITPAQTPAFEAVRDRVESDWKQEAAKKLSDDVYEELRAAYLINQPDDAALSELIK